ncbi:MAG: tRNA (adenosine(37)-N6)-dimethylallyltransferase MiaA [Candidatus Uhrbacteria bacterium]
MKPKIILVLGPTASGKTSLSIKLAQEFSGEVISLDSRQIYREMNIGTAKEPQDLQPTTYNLQPYSIQGIPHHGIDIVDPDQEMSAAEFKIYAEQKIQEITDRGHLPILAGGTGFWAQAIVDNLQIPAVAPDPELRAKLQERDVESLFSEYQKLDPAGAETIDRHNKLRLIRALEVCIKTGRPFSEQQSKGDPKYDVLQLGIETNRSELYTRIDQRVDQMIDEGLVDEVRGLQDKYGCEALAMTGIGYRQICQHLSGSVTLKDSIEQIKQDTRNYAKRQMSWFRRDKRILWINDYDQACQFVSKFLF